MDTTNTNDPTIQGYPPPLVPHPKGYALSGKIMLSAIIILFAVVVIMVCFHIYARWYILRARRRNVRRARRRTHLVFYIDPNNASDIAPNTVTVTRGLDAGVLDSLPTFVYDGKHSRKFVSVVSDEKNDDVEVMECAVCLSEFEVGEKGRVLPKCRHCFHVECIDMWFQSHDTCPLCRAPVEVDQTGLTQLGVEPGCEPGSHVVEMDGLAELTQSPLSQLGESVELSGDVGPSSRRKVLDLVTIEVPRRCHSFSFMNSDESGSGSGSSRVRSLKRFLSRDRKSPLPSPSPSGSSRVEFDIELGKTNPTTPR